MFAQIQAHNNTASTMSEKQRFVCKRTAKPKGEKKKLPSPKRK